jgi:hypothetical protein
MSGQAPEPLVCPLCGFSCEEGGTLREGAPRCTGCVLGPECDLTSCPHCGYSLAPRSRLLDLLRRLFKKDEAPRA